jgi:hypothetical protein
VNDENTHLGDAQIDSIMARYCGLGRFVKMQTLLHDAIHHIDMHMKLLDEETLLIGEYPPGQGDHDRIENTVASLRTLQNCYGDPYRIVRIPMPPDASGHYPPQSSYLTYTNSLIVNKTVLVPIYGLPLDSTAMNIYRNAMPGYRVLGFNCTDIIPSNGAIHCITKEVGVREPVRIAHRRCTDTPDTVLNYRIEARVTARSGIDSVLVFWRTDTTQAFQRAVLAESSGTSIGAIPGQEAGTTVGYYLSVVTGSGRTVTKPLVGPAGPFTFRIQRTTQVASVSVPVRAGWNLLSSPVEPENDSVTVLFPSAVSAAYRYHAGTGYESQVRMAEGTGYWLRFNSTGSTIVTGFTRRADSLAVSPGWNLIGSISEPVAFSDVTTVPAGILDSPFYHFDGTYVVADTLLPGRAYWVRSGAGGWLVMHSPR